MQLSNNLFGPFNCFTSDQMKQGCSIPNMSKTFDLLVIGGGVNGCGIARDAAGRGLSVFLCEKGDLAGATSSASTKLFHGGLRYLEFYKFRLVREALIERETLLRAMPHISRPMRFVLPHHKGMRPAWMLRLGLFIYDHLGGRKILPATKTLDLRAESVGKPLKSEFTKAFEYSDCWVEDSRLVMLNARDAQNNGAEIRTRTKCVSAIRVDGKWEVTLQDEATGGTETVFAKVLVNAAGPWVEQIIRRQIGDSPKAGVRLVRGSHIVVNKLFEHDRAYMFQQPDGRIIFAIPYEQDFTLIGTTDVEHDGAADSVYCTPEEVTYLCHAASEYFSAPVGETDVVWTYSGVRPLYQDGASNASEATRDYVLTMQNPDGEAPVVNIFGGKITTYRKLAEAVLGKLRPSLPKMDEPWTAGVPLPGGDFAVGDVGKLEEQLTTDFPFLDANTVRRFVRQFGTEAVTVLEGVSASQHLGKDFGGVWQVEVEWMIRNEFAKTAEDVLWRRTKQGLRMDKSQIADLDQWMSEYLVGKN